MTRKLSCYVEKHHIIPLSLGGTNKRENLAILTAREHFICHTLLPKMVESSADKRKMCYALHRMAFSKTQLHERYIPASKRFEQIRSIISQGLKGRTMSEASKQKLRNRIVSDETKLKQSIALKGRKFSDETKKKMSVSQKNNLQNPFIIGIEKTKEHRENISKAKKGKRTNWSTPENRKAVSTALLKYYENKKLAANT